VLNKTSVGVIEDGGTDTWTVHLATQPTADVTVAVEKTEEANPEAADIAPTSLTFTTQDWNQPQTVTATGNNDDIVNPGLRRVVVVAHSASGGGYDDAPDVTIEVEVHDDDVEDIFFQPTAISLEEDGGTAEWTVRLKAQPQTTGTITIRIYKSEELGSTDSVKFTTADDSEQRDQVYLEFTAQNYDAPQTVTAHGQNDDLDNPEDKQIVRAYHRVWIGNYDYTTRYVGITVEDDDTLVPPGPPTGLGLVRGNMQLEAAWTAPTDKGGGPLTGYDVEYAMTGSGNWMDAGDEGTDTSHTITGLANGTTYDVRVRAHNGAGSGDWSDIETATPRTVPDAPTALNLTPGNSQLQANWTAPADDGGSPIAGYDVEYALTGSGNWMDAGDEGTDTSHTITQLANGTAYDVRALAHNNAGHSEWSAIQTGTPQAVPGAPTNLNLTPGDAQIAANWTAPADDGGSAITGYDVEYSLTGSGDWMDGGDEGTDTSHTITPLVNGMTYDVRVRAGNSNGSGEWSDIESATPVPEGTAPVIERIADQGPMAPGDVLAVAVAATDADGDAMQYRGASDDTRAGPASHRP